MMSPQSRSSSHDDEHRRKKKVKIMEATGQTDADRRQLRQAQRTLQKQIIGSAEEMENPQEETFGVMRDENNKLWDQVAYTREAVLDGENFDLISSRAARQVDRLVQVPRYDPVRLTQKLTSKITSRVGSTTFFDWTMLGREAGACYNSIPSHVVFLSGPLEADYTPKERKKRAPKQQKQKDEESEEEEPEDVKRQTTNADQLSAVERNIKVLTKTLKHRCKHADEERKAHFQQEEFENEEERKRAEKLLKKQGGNIDAIQYLFNPQSFTQTVENMFHFSFLVKKGDARLSVVHDDGGAKNAGRPMVRAVQKHNKKTPTPRQAVVAFTMQDWRELCEAYKVTKGDIPHRTGSKIKKEKASNDATTPEMATASPETTASSPPHDE